MNQLGSAQRVVVAIVGAYGQGHGYAPWNDEAKGAPFQDFQVYPIESGGPFQPYWYTELRPVWDGDGSVIAIEAVMADRTMRHERK